MEPDITIKRLSPSVFGFDGYPGVACTVVPPFNLKAFDIPRIELSDFIKNHADEFQNKSVVYILLGSEPEEDGRRCTYIGETSSVSSRFDQHLRKKDFWDNALIFTSDYFNETYIKYIENELTKLANHDRSLRVETQRTQESGQTLQADRELCEYYLEIMKRYFLFHAGYWGRLPGLYSMIDDVYDKDSDGVVFYLKYGEFDMPQKMIVIGNKFRIKKGTKISKTEKPSFSTHPYFRNNEDLKNDGIISREKGEFLQDYDFYNPSLPASIIKGQSSNGRTDWKTQDGIAYKDYMK